MFHRYNVYYFIDKFNRDEIAKLDKNIDIIFRNYENDLDEKLIKKIKLFCKKGNRKFYVANNPKIAVKLNLDGVYIPSFNKSLSIKYFANRKIEIIGSAHNFNEIKIKEKQGVNKIFLSPAFKVKKRNYHLGIIKFNLLSKLTSKKIIALGGINNSNLNRINLLNCSGFASISYLKEILKKNE